jgi:hypothetical protein
MSEKPASSANDSAQRERQRWLIALWLAVPLAYLLVILLLASRVGIKDHDQHLVFHSLQYWNSRLFGIAKQWTPVMCGGLSMAADPQVPVFSLAMSLGYLVGPLAGIRLATVAYLAVGWLGTYLYAGLLTSDRHTRALAASLFIGNGFFAARLSEGHIPFLPFLAIPLALWTLHETTRRVQQTTSLALRTALVATVSLLLGAGASVALDGSPQTIAYAFPVLGVYVLTLAVARRSFAPLALAAGALLVALPLGAAYLLPMLSGQQASPRLTDDAFTNPLVLAYYLLIPGRGRVIPAPGGGHEYTLFIGPLLAWLAWRQRFRWRELVPTELARPWIATSAVALLLGVGSLTAIGLPRFLSPFDLLRPLPGFRSIGITGRFWFFLALPLALWCAVAVADYARSRVSRRRLAATMIAILALQIGFQIEGLASHLLESDAPTPVEMQGLFEGEAERIEVVEIGDTPQSKTITPRRAALDCYNNADFERPDLVPGNTLVRTAELAGAATPVEPLGLVGLFPTWSSILLRSSPAAATSPAPDAEVAITLNHAFHPFWTPSAGRVFRTPEGNLAIEVSSASLAHDGVLLRFRDEASDRGLVIAQRAWAIWLAAVAVLLPLTMRASRRHSRRALGL